MLKAFVDVYRELMKKYFDIEPEFKQKFQLQLVRWSFYGQYSNNERWYLIFPIRIGERLMVEIPEVPEVRNRVLELLQEFSRCVKTKDFERYRQVLDELMSIAKKFAKHIYREETIGELVKRVRLS